jgi:hypothetical protein
MVKGPSDPVLTTEPVTRKMMNYTMRIPLAQDRDKPWIVVLYAINPWTQATKVIRFPYGTYIDLEEANNKARRMHEEFPNRRIRLVELRLKCWMIQHGLVKHEIAYEQTLKSYKRGKIQPYSAARR